jgi:hypothetical protein
MSWERFTETNRSFAPRATISKSGYIGFSEGAISRFQISDFTHAVLYYNPVDRLVGIQLTNDPAEPGARQIRRRDKGADFPAKPFLEKHAIERRVTTRYDLSRDIETGYLLIAVDTGTERRSGDDGQD